MKQNVVKYRCLMVYGGCGKIFEVVNPRARCRKCPECQRAVRLKLMKKAKAEKAKRRLSQPIKKNSTGRPVTGLFKMSQAEVAAAMGLSKRTVEEIEMELLTKIRTNPELRNLWSNFKEEIAPGQLRDLIPDPGQQEIELFDYQSALSDWWEVHDMIEEKARLTGEDCQAERLECLREIEKYQQQIKEALCRKSS